VGALGQEISGLRQPLPLKIDEGRAPMDQNDGLVNAYVLDGKGSGKPLDWDGVRAWKPEDGLFWIHLQWTEKAAQDWVRKDSGLDTIIIDALLAEDTRPRCLIHDQGMMLILRGVNLNPGAEPSDMVSVRTWIEQNRIITMRRQRLLAVQDIRATIDRGKGPQSPGDFIVQLALRLTDRVLPVEEDIGEVLDDLEDALVGDQLGVIGVRLSPLRRETIALRRHLSPQRDALLRLYTDGEDWLTDRQRARIREVADRVFRIVEELDAMRERAAIIQDERRTRISERMDRAIYTLSIVATIMLPLSFVTGLLGMNVGGVPGEEIEWAFWGVVGLMAVVGLILILFFRKIGWL
jgi:zinc transporter